MASRGRPVKELDEKLLIDMLVEGISQKDIAEHMEVSQMTISNKIADLKKKESALAAYEKVQHVDLLDVCQRLITGVTDEKIAEAPLQHIAGAYNVFSKANQLIQGRPTEIHGLMGYLMQIEKDEMESGNPVVDLEEQDAN